jgi:hypothetical protein
MYGRAVGTDDEIGRLAVGRLGVDNRRKRAVIAVQYWADQNETVLPKQKPPRNSQGAFLGVARNSGTHRLGFVPRGGRVMSMLLFCGYECGSGPGLVLGSVSYS